MCNCIAQVIRIGNYYTTLIYALSCGEQSDVSRLSWPLVKLEHAGKWCLLSRCPGSVVLMSLYSEE